MSLTSHFYTKINGVPKSLRLAFFIRRASFVAGIFLWSMVTYWTFSKALAWPDALLWPQPLVDLATHFEPFRSFVAYLFVSFLLLSAFPRYFSWALVIAIVSTSLVSEFLLRLLSGLDGTVGNWLASVFAVLISRFLVTNLKVYYWRMINRGE